ncbi:MAG: electron transfer flavoprotein subunit alpha [Gracilibacteraceae bacterium]|jgi:electron transfer flavoprotein beta subunit|nr:electron transfer flavoprotein subunit alpha [Gracilibacteraceae bacterium]
MKIVVVFKWARNPLDARVSADAAVSWPGVKLAASDDDPAAMEIAVALAAGDEVVGLTIGDGDTAWAAARGAARTVVVTGTPGEADSAATGAALAEAVRRMAGVGAVLIGDSAWDYAVISALAGRLGWPAVAGVTAAACSEQGELRVTRRLGAAIQVLAAAGPVVLAVTASRAEKNVPGMKEVLAARKKPAEKIAAADLLDAAIAYRVQTQGTRFPDTPPARVIDGGDPRTACEQLIAALRVEGVI